MELFAGQRRIDFKYFYLIVFIILLFSNDVIFEIVFSTVPEDSGIGNKLHKILTGFAILLTFLNFNKLHPALRFWIILCSCYIFYMVLESFYLYSTPLVYPHVISKITPIFFSSMLYPFFTDRKKETKLRNVIFLYGVLFILCSIISKRDAYSLGAFMNTERGFNASTLYFIMFSSLFFFNKYMKNPSFNYLFLFLIASTLVLFFQHRTVWFTGILAFGINFYIIYNYTKSGIKYSSTTLLTLTLIIVAVISSALLFSYHPELLEKFSDRFNEVNNYKTEGTASWRYEQVQSYLPFVKDNLIFGMRFAGFELPIQFYHSEANVPYFNDGTGHHIHNFYIHTLFYHGLFGLCILIIPIFSVSFQLLKRKHLTIQQATLLSFTISGLLYGISYELPSLFYGILGVTYAFTNIEENKTSEVIQEKEYHL